MTRPCTTMTTITIMATITTTAMTTIMPRMATTTITTMARKRSDALEVGAPPPHSQ